MFGLCSVMLGSVGFMLWHASFMLRHASFMFGYVRDLGDKLAHVGLDEILRTARVGADDLPHDAKHT